LGCIRLTTPERTLLDVSGNLPVRELDAALTETLASGRTTRAKVLTLLERYPRRPGAGLLRTLLEGTRGGLTRSDAERRFLSLIRKTPLPRPATNVRVQGHLVDFHWAEECVVVEVDGFAYHGSRRRFEQDRSRDGDLAAAGIQVLRFTSDQLTKEPEKVLVRLAQTLTQRRAGQDAVRAPRSKL
jgi:very-short-patch-repair endonuclease